MSLYPFPISHPEFITILLIVGVYVSTILTHIEEDILKKSYMKWDYTTYIYSLLFAFLTIQYIMVIFLYHYYPSLTLVTITFHSMYLP